MKMIRTALLVVACVCGLLDGSGRGLQAEVVTLRNGMRYEGAVVEIVGVADNPLKPKADGGAITSKLIVMIDDEVRRVYIPQRMIAALAPGEGAPLERIELFQPVQQQGRRLAVMGDIIRETPFDDWGRRVLVLQGGSMGSVELVQGITVISPVFTKLEGLAGYVSDMRVRTSTLPRDTLSRLLMRQIDVADPDQRLKVVRLYIQSERFKDAREEMERVLKDFPELTELEKQVTALNQLSANRLIQEIELRGEAGQFATAQHLLANFPSTGVAGETLLRVRGLLSDYDKQLQQREFVLTSLETQLAAIKDEGVRAEVAPAVAEIQAELNLNTLDRMADYLRLSSDPATPPEQLVALAVSGWYLGSGAGLENLAVAASFREVRDLVVKYLESTNQAQRDDVLDQLSKLEGGTPRYLAPLIAHLKPSAGELPEPWEKIPGLFELQRSGLPRDDDFRYLIQLPPEYDPYRRYPCVVTLHGVGSDPARQIEWWAGGYSPSLNTRLGQASRRGFIVIAPYWARERQTSYEYSMREHAAVIWTLRDACRRFSIDTDQVFLSGHGTGGDAAWDIALAHPDLWAGAIPMVASSDKYITRYWENAERVPLYFVFGELDGSRLIDNATNLDRYLTRMSGQFDTTVVEYRGRGPDHFIDEVQEIFKWMTLPSRRRDFLPKEFKAVTMRPWDSYFWWVETENLPARSMVMPLNWPDNRARPATIEARALPNNRVVVNSPADTTTVWLAPEIVDFDRAITVDINNRTVKDDLAPSAAVILEDVRLRCDRQHPFWAKARL